MGSGVPAAVRADGPAGYWRLGEATGTTARSETTAGTATYINAPALGQAGAVPNNTAVSLNGWAQYASAGDVFDYTGAFSVEAWFKPTQVDASYRRIVSKELTSPTRQGYLVFVQNGRLGFERWKDGSVRAATSTATAITGAWNHMVASYDGTTMRLYLNGWQVASTVTSMTLLDHTGPFDIGARESGSESFYGVIDEVAVYPAALSAARVLDHYNASLPQVPATTLAYYPIGTTADNPCTQAIEADDQGAALRSRTGPDPDGDGAGEARVEEFVYDRAGRPVAFRVGTGAWSCVAYDARGRQATRSIPAAGAEPAVTYTSSYAVGANAQISSVVCHAGGRDDRSLGPVWAYVGTSVHRYGFGADGGCSAGGSATNRIWSAVGDTVSTVCVDRADRLAGGTGGGGVGL